MKIQLIEAIQMELGQRVHRRLPMTKIDFGLEPLLPDMEISRDAKHIARVEVWFSQIAPVTAAAEMRQTAARAISHHIYQDVEAEIHKVLRDLWQEGLHNTAAAKRLAAMIPVLRGEVQQ